MAQQTDAQLTTQANVIRNETVANANTKVRVADMAQNLNDSKINNDKIVQNVASPNATDVPSTQALVDAINALIGGAPGALDTLNELATALGDDENFATTITNLIATKMDKAVIDGFSNLTDGASVDWNADNKKFPLAKLTCTQSFTLNITNVLNGANGILKIITNTASAVTITFDTDFTNKSQNTNLTTYTLPAGTGKEYFLSFASDGTVLEWIIGDGVSSTITPSARVTKTTAQSLTTGTNTIITWEAETADNASIWDVGNPSRFTVPGTGTKLVTVNVQLWFANGAGYRRLGVVINGGDPGSTDYTDSIQAVSGTITYMRSTFLVSCSGGDFIEVFALQSSGGNLNVAGSGVANNCTVKVEDI